MRPAPAIERPAVALNNATPAAALGPVSKTRVPVEIDIDRSFTNGPARVDDGNVNPS